MTGTYLPPFLDSADIILGFTLILFVAGFIATYGEQIRMRP